MGLTRTEGVRIGLAVAVAVTAVWTALAVPGGTGGGGDRADLVAAGGPGAATGGEPHVDPPGAAPHRHDDPATKNLISRGAEVGEGAVDPTTAVQKRRSAAYVERERALRDPELTTVPAYQPRAAVPQDRYAMANGCYTLQAPSGAYVVLDQDAVALGEVARRDAARLYFKPTRLGGYLLHAEGGEVSATDDGVALAEPSPAADWTVRRTRAARFTFRLAGGDGLVADGDELTVGAPPTRFALRRAGGCTPYPEAGVDVTGDPHAGVTPYQEVRGYVDAHTHGMAFEFLGGQVHCGRPWHQYGAPYALVDCPDHHLTGGKGAVLEAFLSGEPSHDPVGWPTFVDWPAPNSLTHEGTYYRWLERAWRGGQRLFVNLLVENNKLCELYPLKRNSCDDMDSIRLQARQMYAFQDYVDAQFGGPGKGFYRIVTDPFEAREVINAGKMAVVMGIETSVPFGCTFKAVLGTDQPACTAAEIDQQLDEMHALGVRQMELVNKFDNALAGVAGDSGEVGVFVNTANFLETGTFWRMEHCEPPDGESADKPQIAVPEISAEQQDALFGAIGELFGGLLPAVPIYPPPAHCNARGLTDLGEHTIRGLADRQMIFDPDHLSVRARQASMDLIEELGYHGVISSHSWSTPDTYPRIYQAGGFITPYAGDSTGFVEKWRRHVEWADPRYYWGFGFGADINGLGAQGDPRGADVANPVTYPISGLNGVRIDKQTAGERVWDINVDGVAQYGLYPDWIEDLRQVADAQDGDGAAIVDDMTRGAEAYLQMWERAVGVAPDSCRNPSLRKTVAEVRSLVRPGMTTEQVLRAVGQPYRRLGASYGLCARTEDRPRVMVKVTFDDAGKGPTLDDIVNATSRTLRKALPGTALLTVVAALGAASAAADEDDRSPRGATCLGEPVTVFLAQGDEPTAGDDVILGTRRIDQVHAHAGDDVICTLGGADAVEGGGGRDRVSGGDGNDTVIGGPKRDRMLGGGGSDDITGSRGHDVAKGGADDDDVWGVAGNDRLAGGGGADFVVGGSGDDAASGSAGPDTLYGDDGDDVLAGGAGDDVCYGGAGRDRISGC